VPSRQPSKKKGITKKKRTSPTTRSERGPTLTQKRMDHTRKKKKNMAPIPIGVEKREKRAGALVTARTKTWSKRKGVTKKSEKKEIRPTTSLGKKERKNPLARKGIESIAFGT